MPFIRCVYSGNNDVKDAIGIALSKAVADALGKPESYVCVDVTQSECLYFGGSKDPCAMIQIESIGGSSKEAISSATTAVAEVAGIPSDRIFVTFTSIEGKNWGMAGNTFG